MSMGEINNLAAFAARGVDSENEDEDDDIDENDLLVCIICIDFLYFLKVFLEIYKY